MPETDEKITARLTRALESRISSETGGGYRLCPDPPQRLDRRYSFIFRYWLLDHAGRRRPMFLKIPHPADMKTMEEAIHFPRLGREIKREFEVLNAISEVIRKSGNPRLTAVQPMGYSLEFNAIYMEELDLRMLKDRLLDLRIIAGDAKQWDLFSGQIARAGEWLRVMHDEFHRGRFAALEELGMQEMIDAEFAVLENTLGSGLSRLWDLFRRVYEKRKTEQIPISALHYDFHLGNIFVAANGQVGALDPNWRDAGPIFQDLATLLIDPPTRKLQVVSQGMLYRSDGIRRFEQAVIGGYFGDRQTDFPPLLNLYCAYFTLLKWRMNAEALKGQSLGGLVASFTGGYFQRLIKAYLNREMQESNPWHPLNGGNR